MNFYRHYIGDFQRDTGHMSLAERGAYRAIMDHYYAREEGPRAELDHLCRIAGATTAAERKAVKVAMEMFEVKDGRLWHKRVEAELVKAADRSDTNRDIALAREKTKRERKAAQAEHEQSTNRAPDVPPEPHEQSTKPLTSKQLPFPNGNGAPPAPDPIKAIFDTGVSILTASGDSPKEARTTVGKLRQLMSDPEAFAVLASARDKTDPRGWIYGCIAQREKSVRIDKNGLFRAVT